MIDSASRSLFHKFAECSLPRTEREHSVHLTAYFVGAVANLSAHSIDDVLFADRCQRAAPLRHWSRDLLFSRRARASRVEPDLVPLAWNLQDRVSPDPRGLARPRPA